MLVVQLIRSLKMFLMLEMKILRKPINIMGYAKWFVGFICSIGSLTFCGLALNLEIPALSM